MKALAFACTLAFALPASFASAQDRPGEDAAPSSARSILNAAFVNRYEVDQVSDITLVMRNGSGKERRRVFQAVAKMIDGRLHSVGRLTAPDYLRDVAILTIEKEDRSHDAFVFLPSLGKVRRVPTAQRGDSFFGSDVTYEDLERQTVDDYELDAPRAGEFENESVWVIRGKTLRPSNYERVQFSVAQSDGSILETRYYKRRRDDPFRVVVVPRDAIVERGGHVLPTRLLVRGERRGTTTEVVISNLEVNAPIDDRVFSVAALEQERRLPEPER